ncbi:MAG: IS110 family transposase [Phycisphaeraceae bacterium JB051]
MTTPVYIGIDISKTNLDIATPDTYIGQVTNDLPGHQQLLKQLATLGPVHVAIEASGGYERPLLKRLQKAACLVSLLQPACVRHFAKSINLHAKTDKLDAQLIAKFVATTKPQVTQKVDKTTEKLRALRDRRKQIVEDRVREQNRLECCHDAQMAKMIKQSITRLQKFEAQLDDQLAKCLKQSPEHQAKAAILIQVKGVAEQTITTLLGHLPQLGHVNRQQISALAGLAPYAHDSGRHKGKRKIRGGRAAVRCALFMACRSAVRYDPVMRDFYQRLIAAGKLHKVAMCACARKLLIHLNSLCAKAQALPGKKAAGA